ncbi:hypothetical protein DEO72_LG6g391 [Vigna unguiculata]|uniref:Uncharacterized protein n=1 Tax=Vigna unguiculata TaxID=3917 RepID=A0A4D6M6A2_VIGUN|nr:hypothetical protein DEO72_LG6g391 [Vigna unguiculata]
MSNVGGATSKHKNRPRTMNKVNTGADKQNMGKPQGVPLLLHAAWASLHQASTHIITDANNSYSHCTYHVRHRRSRSSPECPLTSLATTEGVVGAAAASSSFPPVECAKCNNPIGESHRQRYPSQLEPPPASPKLLTLHVESGLATMPRHHAAVAHLHLKL